MSRWKSRRAIARSDVVARYSRPSSSTSSAESRVTRPRALETSCPSRDQRARRSSTKRSIVTARTYHGAMAVQLGRLEVETPDHVVLRYDLAGGGNRGFAALVDFFIATVIFVGSLFVMQQAVNAFGPGVLVLQGVAILLTFLVTWCYFILLEWLWHGQTIGKRMYGLRVIGEDGSAASFTAVL